MPSRTITHRINGFSLSLSRDTSQLEITSDDSADEMMVIEADELCALATFLRIPHIAAMVDEMSAQLCAEEHPAPASFARTADRRLVAYTDDGGEIIQGAGESQAAWVERCRAAGIAITEDAPAS